MASTTLRLSRIHPKLKKGQGPVTLKLKRAYVATTAKLMQEVGRWK